MATFLAWLQANGLAVVAAIAAAIFGYRVYEDKKKDKVDPEVVADDGSNLDALLAKVTAKLSALFERLGMRKDAAVRSTHQFFLICIEDDVRKLPEGPERAEQLAAIQTLAKYRVLSEPEQIPTRGGK